MKPENKKKKPASEADRLKPHRWKPGQSGNPLGRPPLPADLKNVKEFDGHQLKRLIAKHLSCNLESLSSILSNPDARSIDILIAKTLMVCLESGNIEKAEFLFRRSFGSVTENVKLGVKQLGDKSPEERMAAGRAAIAFLESQRAETIEQTLKDESDNP